MSEAITLINAFTVPQQESDRFLRRWKDNAQIMAGQPGFIQARMYRSPDADVELRFVNVAEWASREALDQATAHAAWRASARRMLDDHDLRITPRPAVYLVAVELQPGRHAVTTPRVVAYWVATALIAAEFGAGGVTDALHLPPFFATLLQLGYPAYVGTILGVWKVLGTAAVLAPGLPRLKEWAYAAMIFDLTGAVASSVAVGWGVQGAAFPIVFIGLVAASWGLRPPGRRDVVAAPHHQRRAA
jgi:heme-degrading monooxygenase HmoA